MRALVFGVEGKGPPVGDDETNPLVRGLSTTPMDLLDVDDPEPIGPDWVVLRTRMTGICGSDSKQVFMDFGNEVGNPDNPMKGFFSLPQVLGHEVVADVVELGPEASRGTSLEVGDRVVLNPWLSCAPRGVSPVFAIHPPPKER